MMASYLGYAVSGLLGLSAILLGLLIPGGSIENRDFSHIRPTILGLFNVFLTVLGMGSLVLVYFSFIGSKLAIIAAAFCGVSYCLVYTLDLGKVFPVSPDKMPRALFWIESIGLMLSIPLTLCSLSYLFISKESAEVSGLSSGGIIFGMIMMAALGIGIVIFATKSAMRQSPEKADSKTHTTD